MRIDILTLFPEMFQGPFNHSILKRAQENNLLQIDTINIRDFSQNKHHTVDDTPYGGGAGMVMGPEPLFECFDHLKAKNAGQVGRVIMMCPQGEPFTQEYAKELAREENLVIVCGHYEGIDERVREVLVTDEISIGDYVLTGGELPAMVVVDAVARMIPGVLGETASAEEDSFYNGLLEHPHFTKPREYRGYEVPEILLSGHHGNIRKWRRRQSLLRTLERRPELLKDVELSKEDKKVLLELQNLLLSLNLKQMK
ncbi:tRNA (Guanine37-N(1)-) methyltransferase [Desulforamulus reducens MI-1]|uniref:tRNA (guanine-N(1)-)-methyltransferase n=1 Tax=Desulforamulus reducens (strain ATCC BAA-1160 / DSM 100696 / MI-1) TaxID=349161 RepID=TRMD_DESRM|nr:tRNA (guanosine(37)-N1)-methyltransferase TrmD [Desulforamulus reducens]A4J665.1 RecName: Full=tRNA (guanine-N(1)-)-methyltransferase; AltName: Full=M1G-methyltransferase; AltName: Full=tRNA [GM37] methyltransferase [Desulforamulus reducens MI-1]ABO50568.1 tRNA (Guanine37-N(1)-) methyltransferase [Desulforamulus reducens MI-1]